MNKALVLKADSSYGLKEMTYEDGKSYDFIRGQVGGYLESVPNSYFYDKGIDVWCNEEGKLMGLPFSVALSSEPHKIFDMVAGDIVFTRYNDEGETISLTDEDIAYIKNWYDTAEWHVDLARGTMIPIMTY